MPWARLDDRFHDNRKVRRVWRSCPAAIGLHVMAITYSAGHLTDGFVDNEFVEDRMPVTRQREKAISMLVEVGMWHADADGWRIHDFAEYNVTRKSALEKHESRSEAGKKGANARWGNGKSMAAAIDADSESHDGKMPPSRPDPEEAKASSSGADRADKENEKATDADRANCRLFAELAPTRNMKVKIPKAGTAAWAAWIREMRLLRASDSNSADEITRAIRWLFTDPSSDAVFWGTTVQAPSGLREHFPTVWAKMTSQPSVRAVPAVETSAEYLKRRGAA